MEVKPGIVFVNPSSTPQPNPPPRLDPNTSFHKAVKWSRVVIRNVPKRRWVADESGVRDEDTGAPHGNFVPVTKGDLEAELHTAHPLLADTVFMEGPDWTRRPSSTQDDKEATANVSFTIPDHTTGNHNSYEKHGSVVKT